MAISGGLRLFGAFAPHPNKHPFQPISSSSKMNNCGVCLGGRSNFLEITPKQLHMNCTQQNYHRGSGITATNEFSAANINQEAEGFLLSAVNMGFFARLNLAWRILFPTTTTTRRHSNANVAKQRLKMILFSDRCAVSDEAKRKIVSSVVGALSDFVEIDSRDKVQLSVSMDPDLGTVYSVTVPVLRVKQEYQDCDELGGITNIEYKDKGETSGSVDVRFDFFVPSDK